VFLCELVLENAMFFDESSVIATFKVDFCAGFGCASSSAHFLELVPALFWFGGQLSSFFLASRDVSSFGHEDK
jgi:hypothetical protein